LKHSLTKELGASVNAHLKIEDKLEDKIDKRIGIIEERFEFLENYVLKELDQVVQDEVEILKATISESKGKDQSGNVTQ